MSTSPDSVADDGESQQPEVKTLTFTTLRSFLPEYFGDERYQAIRANLGVEARAQLDEAEPGGWAPEAQLHELMDYVYRDILRGEDAPYLEFARALAATGINRFMRIFLSLASQRFVLRKIPVVWDRLRRNAGRVTVDIEGELLSVHYEGFPFFGDHVYRLLSLANCQALVLAATHRLPAGRVARWSSDSLTLEFDLNARNGSDTQ